MRRRARASAWRRLCLSPLTAPHHFVPRSLLQRRLPAAAARLAHSTRSFHTRVRLRTLPPPPPRAFYATLQLVAAAAHRHSCPIARSLAPLARVSPPARTRLEYAVTLEARTLAIGAPQTSFAIARTHLDDGDRALESECEPTVAAAAAAAATLRDKADGARASSDVNGGGRCATRSIAAAICRAWWMRYSLEPHLRRFFYWYGGFVHTQRWLLFVLPILVTPLLSIGFLWFSELNVDDPAYVFTPRDAR